MYDIIYVRSQFQIYNFKLKIIDQWQKITRKN